MRQAIRFLATWVGCIVIIEAFVFGVAFGLAGAGRRVTLSRAWSVATGTVEAVDRNNHNAITVRYTVEGQKVEQTFMGSEKSVGDTVNVYYSPTDWHLADIENPTISLQDDLRLFLAGGLVLDTFVTAAAKFRAVAWKWAKFRLTP